MSEALSDIPSDKLTSYAAYGTVEGALAFPPYATHSLMTGWLFWFCASELFLHSKYYIFGYTSLMPNFLRYRIPGGCYFFTVNLLERNTTLLTDPIYLLRESVRTCKRNYRTCYSGCYDLEKVFIANVAHLEYTVLSHLFNIRV